MDELFEQYLQEAVAITAEEKPSPLVWVRIRSVLHPDTLFHLLKPKPCTTTKTLSVSCLQ